MNREEIVRAALQHTVQQTNVDGVGELYRGKVRDVYSTEDRIRRM